MLPGAYEELGDLDAVLGHLDALRTLDLVALDREADQAWMFKHVVTQEVAYESLPFALRAVLHGLVGDYIERTEAGDLDRGRAAARAPLLAERPRGARSASTCGKAAQAAQASYANNAAIVYYERLVPLLEGRERVEAMLALGASPRADRRLGAGRDGRRGALALSERRTTLSRQAWATPRSPRSARKQGRFDAATASSDAAEELLRATGDDAGLGQVWHLAGTVAAQRGDLELARRRYEDSLAIRERLGDQSKIGVAVLEPRDRRRVQRRPGRGSRAWRSGRSRSGPKLNDRWGIGVSLGQPRRDRRQGGQARRGARSRSRRRCGCSRGRRPVDDREHGEQPRQRGPRPRRLRGARVGVRVEPATVRPWTTAGRSRSCSRTSRCWRPLRAITAGPSRSPRRPGRCARRSAPPRVTPSRRSCGRGWSRASRRWVRPSSARGRGRRPGRRLGALRARSPLVPSRVCGEGPATLAGFGRTVACSRQHDLVRLLRVRGGSR